ncbi:MAG: hypothetical protein ABI811_23255 [Acidobacteriota bacterium]
MRQAAAALFGAGFTAVTCYAFGVVLLDRLGLSGMLRRPERYPLGFTLGAAALHLLLFALLALHIAYWPVIIGLMLAAILRAYRSGACKPQGSELERVSGFLKLLLAVVEGTYFVLYFIYAWAPEHSPDGSSYHLGIIARYIREHGFVALTSSIYAMLGQGVELIFLPAFIIGRHSAAALTHLSFAVALAFAMLAYGQRLGKPWVGGAAALFVFLSPVFGLTASIAYIDAATAAVVFASFYFLEIWDREREVNPHAWKLLIAVGLLAGYAYAAKYTTFTIGVYSLGFVAWKTRRLKPVLLVAACAALMAGPWIVRNAIVYQNPAAPLGNSLFRNPFVHVMFEREYSEFLRHYGVVDRRTLPLDVTIGGERTTGLIGPLFLLLPFGLLALRRRAGRHLWIAAALLLSTFLLNVGTRFLIPALPFLSLTIALAAAESPALLCFLILFHAVASWPSVIPSYADKYAWRIERPELQAALRVLDTDTFLAQHMGNYAATRMLDRYVPDDEPVLTQSGIPDSYTRREIRVGFQSAPNEVLLDMFQMGWLVGSQPIRSLNFRFPERTARRFRVQQTAATPPIEQWNIHELRFFHQGRELARKPEWRLQAWPNPWDVLMAFDNSPATRWRSWETPAPGMYIEVDFGADTSVDEIRIETSSDSANVRVQPEVWNGSGWEKLPAQLEGIDVAPNPNARRMATHEIHLKGVNYFLIFDTDFGSVDVRDDPEAWGLTLLATEGGARIYKSTW